MKLIIWGLGEFYKISSQKGIFDQEDILAYVDNNINYWGGVIHNKLIIKPSEISNYNYEKIILCMYAYEDVLHQCVETLGIDRSKIIPYEEYEANLLCEKMVEKYEHAEDPEIQSVVDYYKNNGFNLFGKYENTCETMDLVHYDQTKTPYILFEGKKMFFPKNFNFWKENNEKYIKNILFEQGKGSPHLYVRNSSDIKENAVIVDAGVCEGNFALRYVDKVKKIYLIESDPLWVEALQKTFSEYRDKVVICDKFLSRYDTKKTITLDSLVKEQIDFVKMDIEGYEADALLGGRNIFTNSESLKCAICSYHNKRDEEYIKLILNTYGYKTEVSEGYICFQHDINIFDTLDFRRGVVYGEKT